MKKLDVNECNFADFGLILTFRSRLISIRFCSSLSSARHFLAASILFPQRTSAKAEATRNLN